MSGASQASIAPANPKDSATPLASLEENVANPGSPEEHTSNATSLEETAPNDSGSMHPIRLLVHVKTVGFEANYHGCKSPRKLMARPVVIGVIRIYLERLHGVHMR
jgi:hypothetical protein